MSQVKSSVATPSEAQSDEQSDLNSSLSIRTLYSSTSPKIRELKERFEASRATANTQVHDEAGQP